jgi:hypothetical protein
VADWVTISSLATAGGTLALAIATFSSVRSSDRSARIAEQALQEQRRPLLMQARLEDPAQKIMFADGHWIQVQGSGAAIHEDGDTLYLGVAVRNVGAGIAVLQGWYVWPRLARSDVDHRPAEEFRRQIRDIYVAPGDVTVWQGALRAADGDLTSHVAAARSERRPFSVDLLYSDQVGAQRTISRFAVSPVGGEEQWVANVGLHWSLDRAGPR